MSSGHNVVFEQEPVKVWILCHSITLGCLIKDSHGQKDYCMLLDPSKQLNNESVEGLCNFNIPEKNSFQE